MAFVFRLLAFLISIYTVLCIIRIILTWIPGIAYSKFAQFMSTVCDPFLKLFSKIKWCHVGGFDFSPAIALCLLGALSSLFNSLAVRQTVSVQGIIGLVISLVWAIISAVLTFFIILLIVRLIIVLTNGKANYSPIIQQIDRALQPILYKLIKPFHKKPVTYKKALIAGLVIFIIIHLVLGIGIFFASRAIFLIPFPV